MQTYLGQLGRLVGFKGPSAQSHEVDDGYTFERTLEGKVKAQAFASRRRRQWNVKIGAATPADMGSLFAFIAGEWGVGPFVWISPDAQVTNMLTPAQASCDPSVAAGPEVYSSGPLALGGGYAGRSLTNSAPGSNMYFGTSPVPVLQGVQVTASAYLLGAGARVGLTFYTADGTIIDGTAVESAEVGNDASASRLHLSTNPPAGAAYCLIYGANTVQGARPAVTWTDTVFEWADGAGCPKAVIHGLSRDVLLALQHPGHGRYANATFTVQEVG